MRGTILIHIHLNVLLIGSFNVDHTEVIGFAGKVNSAQCTVRIVSADGSLSMTVIERTGLFFYAL